MSDSSSQNTPHQNPNPAGVMPAAEALAAAAAAMGTDTQAAQAPASLDPLADAQAELANVKAQNATLADQYLRAQADVQNARRRADEEAPAVPLRPGGRRREGRARRRNRGCISDKGGRRRPCLLGLRGDAEREAHRGALAGRHGGPGQRPVNFSWVGIGVSAANGAGPLIADLALTLGPSSRKDMERSEPKTVALAPDIKGWKGYFPNPLKVLDRKQIGYTAAASQSKVVSRTIAIHVREIQISCYARIRSSTH